VSIRTQLEKYARDWMTFPADAALLYRLEGIPGVWRSVVERSVHRVFRTGRLILYAQSLDCVPDVRLPPGVTIGPIQEEEWPALKILLPQRQLPRSRALVESGCHFLIAWRGSAPIGYAWVAERITPLVTQVPLPLPEDAAYLWDLYVVPAERSNGVGSALAQARLKTAQALGFREGWRAIAPTNKPSLRTLAKSGSEHRMMGELRYVKLLNRLHVRHIPAAGVVASPMNREKRT
jgi:GNAT superfamily N-acetyltransferase